MSINREHTLAVRGRKAYETHAVRCGEGLIKAKQIVTGGKYRGGWMRWVEQNCEFDQRTCNDYMHEAELKSRRGANSEDRTRAELREDRRAARVQSLPEPQPEYDPMQHLGERDTTHVTDEFKVYLDALRVFQRAVEEAAKLASITPERRQYLKTQHDKLRKLLTQLEGK